MTDDDIERFGFLRPYWLDASALVKLIFPQEVGFRRVEGLVRENSWFETTWLCVAEAHGALKRRYLKGELDSHTYHLRLYQLRSWIQEGRIKVRMAWLQDTPINPHDVRRTAEKYGLDFSDAIQLFEFRTGTISSAAGRSEAVFVSSDKALLAAARAEGMKVWNPEVEQEPPK